MKSYKSFLFILTFSLLILEEDLIGQAVDPPQIDKEYTVLSEALKEPEKVFRLNLSNQTFDDFTIGLSKFKNLRYLSLRNDHLTTIPAEIGTLKNLEVLDLGGNNFQILPEEFIKLQNLEELYMDEDKNLLLSRDFDILGKLPKLKILHLESNNIDKLPRNIDKLTHLESLYLSNNLLHFIPPQVKKMKNLKYLEIKLNPLPLNLHLNQLHDAGLKIKF
jgi:Leucine-rich repeat (LRR) protein